MSRIITRIKDKIVYSDFRKVFNMRTNESRGRSMVLVSNLVSGVVNIFVAGVFYTGFLSVNGIDIVRVGVIAFIPYMSAAISLLSPRFLSLFKKRRLLLICNSVFYWSTVVLATTIMPFFVKDYGHRTIWFAVFLCLGNVSNSLIGSGATAWQINFLPSDQDRRGVYFSYLTLSATVISSITAVVSSLLADRISGNVAEQAAVINTMRFIAFGLMIVNASLLYNIPKEYEYKAVKNVRLYDVFVVPLRYSKFKLTLIIYMIYNFIACINGSTWPYFAMNTIGINYMTMYTGTFVAAIAGIFLMPAWRAAIHKHSWQKVMLFIMFCYSVFEFSISFATVKTKWVYVVVAVMSGFISVGTNQVFANLFYVNLPPDVNCDLFATLWSVMANLSVFATTLLGAWVISLTEPHGAWTILGLPFYGSQFIVWGKGAMYFMFCIFIKWVTPRVQPEQ